jgi:hypothetical protein
MAVPVASNYRRGFKSNSKRGIIRVLEEVMKDCKTIERLYGSTKQFMENIQSLKLHRGSGESIDKLLDFVLACDLYIKRNPL